MDTPSVKKNIKFTIQYDGTEYHGWQVQPEGKTIQGTIEQTAKKIAPDCTSLLAAGRTDTGVHALEQTASVKTAVKHSPATIQKALNAQLPSDIRIIGADYCDISFHPRHDAKKKRYVYFIHNGPIISPFVSRYAWNIPYKLNISLMKKSALKLVGRHDFSSFQAAGCSAKNPIREVFSLDIKKAHYLEFLNFKIKGIFLVFSIEATAFLRHMARNIVGTLIEAGRGKLTDSEIKKILAIRDRTCAGPTAPAWGLFLEKILY